LERWERVKATELIEQLKNLIEEYGDSDVSLLVENLETFGQIEMPLGSLAYSTGEREIKLLSVGFT
jgi:hypothetical protein